MKRLLAILLAVISVVLFSVSIGVRAWDDQLTADQTVHQTTTVYVPFVLSIKGSESAQIVSNEDWRTYTHPTWGVSFQYPPDWVASIPDFTTLGDTPEGEAERGYDSSLTPEQIEYARTLGHGISVYPKDNELWGNAKIEIALSTFTLSPQGSLEQWLTIKHQWNEDTGMPLSLQTEAVDSRYVPADVDHSTFA